MAATFLTEEDYQVIDQRLAIIEGKFAELVKELQTERKKK